MRGIAATRAQQSRGLLPAIDAYARMIAEAITQALPLVASDGTVPRPGGPAALVLFGAEQGFAGAFGDRMMAAVDGLVPGTALFLIGSRAARQAQERGLQPAWQTAMAAHTGAITVLATRIAEALYAALPEAGFRQVEMVFPIWRPGAELQVERRSLLPLDARWFPERPLDQPPLITLPPARLLEQLAEEYVTAQLCEAATHAFAAENEARAAAMMRAKSNISGMLETLSAEERRVRQEAITAEVVELATGSGMF
jgi:F-type H+-transporting ATPase subunit gamma